MMEDDFLEQHRRLLAWMVEQSKTMKTDRTPNHFVIVLAKMMEISNKMGDLARERLVTGDFASKAPFQTAVLTDFVGHSLLMCELLRYLQPFAERAQVDGPDRKQYADGVALVIKFAEKSLHDAASGIISVTDAHVIHYDAKSAS